MLYDFSTASSPGSSAHWRVMPAPCMQWWDETQHFSSSTDFAKALLDEPAVIQPPKNAPSILLLNLKVHYHIKNKRVPLVPVLRQINSVIIQTISLLSTYFDKLQSPLRSSNRSLLSTSSDQNLPRNIWMLPRVYNLTLISQIGCNTNA